MATLLHENGQSHDYLRRPALRTRHVSRRVCSAAQIVDMTAVRESVLVDLVEIRSVCAAVVDWFDSYTAGTPSPIDELDRAVTRAKTLPHLPGALGRALAAIATGGGGTRNDIVDVVDQLRRAAPVANVHCALKPCVRRRSTERRQLPRDGGQLTLPLAGVRTL
jgi:hypothetical protein